MIIAHKIELKPTIKQKIAFAKACGVSRYTYNWGLDNWNKQYKDGLKPTALKLKKQWNQEKPEWAYDSPKDANQSPFTNLQKAFNAFFKKKGKHPKFKCKGVHDSFYISNDKFHVNDRYVRIPKIGSVKMKERLRFSGKITSGTVSKVSDRWFISISVDMDYIKPRTKNDIIGIDIGIKNAITLSTGEKISGPKPLKKTTKKMATLQRKLSRKQKGSYNRFKAKCKVSRLHYRISNIRKDFLHKATTNLCRENQTIVIEDLCVKGMMANHKLARSISDIGFYEFRRQLTYKSKIYGNNLVIADRWFPSTKTCNRCGLINDIPLSQRVYTCECGYVEDRDVNAALNLRTLGLRGNNACGHDSSGLVEMPGETVVDEARTKPCSEMSTY